MTQQVHYWLYTPPNKQTNKQTKKKTQKNQEHQFKRIYALQCSYHYYLQLSRYGSNLNVYQQTNG